MNYKFKFILICIGLSNNLLVFYFSYLFLKRHNKHSIMYFPLLFAVSPHRSVIFFCLSYRNFPFFTRRVRPTKPSILWHYWITSRKALESKRNWRKSDGAKSGEYGECIQQIMSKTFMSCSLDTLFDCRKICKINKNKNTRFNVL